MKKINILKMPVLLVISLLLVGVASAVLLTSFGVITARANVAQAIVVDGQNSGYEILAEFDIVGGSSECILHNVSNNAEILIGLTIDSVYDEEGIEVILFDGDFDGDVQWYPEWDEFDVESNETLNFTICYVFAADIVPDVYDIVTTIGYASGTK